MEFQIFQILKLKHFNLKIYHLKLEIQSINAFKISPDFEQEYIAVGFDNGKLQIYETKSIEDKQLSMYHEFTSNKSSRSILDICFFKAGNSNLLGSLSYGQLDVFSLEDRTLLYQNNAATFRPENLFFYEPNNQLIIYTEEHKVYELSLNYNIRYFEEFAEEYSYVFDKKMMKTFFNEADKDN